MIRKMVVAALVSVLIMICSWITIPGPVVPFTLQTFAIALAWKLMGGLRGTLAVTIYILLGIIGVPVFAGFGGGVGTLIGPSGGYIIGFLPGGIIYAVYQRTIWPQVKHKKIGDLVIFGIGMVVCYFMGFTWFVNYYLQDSSMSFWRVFLYTIVPFIIPDAIKIYLGWKVGGMLNKHLAFNR